jgi:hypothetical protein
MSKHKQLEQHYSHVCDKVKRLEDVLGNLEDSASALSVSVYQPNDNIHVGHVRLEIDDILPYEMEAGYQFLATILARYKYEAEGLRRKLQAVEELLGEAS